MLTKPGIILIDKESGYSSAKVVAKVKAKLKLKKVGHGGTLDPGATGLLACLVNGATRLASFVEHGDKEYTGLLKLGVTTSTDDAEGEVLTTSNDLPTEDQVHQASKNFLGEIEQVPPAISAVRIDGERAYKRARRGEKVDIKARKVRVSEFELTATGDKSLYEYRVNCSRGTYIRSLARDLGELLGCGGSIETLRRTASYPFDVKNAVKIDDLEESHILSWDELFPNSQSLILSAEQVKMLCAGDNRVLQSLPEPQNTELGVFYEEGNAEPLGLLKLESDTWKIAANIV